MAIERRPVSWSFWLQWVLASTLGETVALLPPAVDLPGSRAPNENRGQQPSEYRGLLHRLGWKPRVQRLEMRKCG